MTESAPKVVLAAILSLSAVERAAPDTPPPVFPSDAQVVLLDLVAHGRDGRPLADLRAAELSVFEDDKPCEILSLRRVQSGVRSGSTTPSKAPGARTGPGSPEPATTPARANLVVLVFDRLTTTSAPLARKGALDLLGHSFPPDTWFAVFKVGYGTRLLEPFTSDPSRVRAAVEAATTGDADKLSGPLAPLLPPVARATGQAIGPANVVLPDLRPVAEAVSAMERELAERIAGFDSLYAVRGIAQVLQAVQGRKAVVYFAEAWHLPTSTRGVYDETVSATSRANVAVHTVDARGLTSHKAMALTPIDSFLDTFTAEARAADGDPREGTKRPATFDTLEKQLTGPTLERLADDTGGLAIANTNDLGAGLLRVAEELRQYYEVVYAPPNPVLDGRFRRIRVKVSRPGAKLRTRAGYFASPLTSPALAAYELPLMAALAAETPARSFSLRAGVLHFAPKGAERQCLVLAEVPLSEVQIVSDEAAGRFRAHLSLFGYLKDAEGRVAARLTHDWPIEGPLADTEKARQTNAVFRRALTLVPGVYVLETAVQDRQSGGTSVQRTRFRVPAPGDGLALGSPTLLRGVTTAAAGTADDPLRVGDLALAPALGAPFVLGSSPALPVYVGVYPGAPAGAVELTVELLGNAGAVARAAPALPPVDAAGRIPWLGGIPADHLQPGAYELAVTARRGPATIEERTTIEIVAGRPRSVSAVVPPATVTEAEPLPRTSADPALLRVLERAARYVVDYEEAFRNVVAEETYTQRYDNPGAARVDPFHPSGRALVTGGYRQRVTRADLVFVRLAGDPPWGLFRDVFLLNGKKVRDRDERLERLFRSPSPSALQQARRILEESARYNIGARRTLNLPTLPLLFLHPHNQKRFRFELARTRRSEGLDTIELLFEERSRPTLITDSAGGDLPASGRFWIDPQRGTVVRSETVFRFEPHLAEGSIQTEYRRQPRLGIWVPYEMKEDYRDLPGASRRVFGTPTQATARYANFRQFSVTTEEKAALPPD